MYLSLFNFVLMFISTKNIKTILVIASTWVEDIKSSCFVNLIWYRQPENKL